MSHYDYVASRNIVAQDPPFYAVIMAAMRMADSYNELLLRDAFPEVWRELQKRYDAPHGYLASELDSPDVGSGA